MRRLAGVLGDLPAVPRRILLGVVGLVLLVFLGSGGWAFFEHRETVARRALVNASATAHQAMAGAQEAALASAAEALRQFLNDYPRSRVASQAWYLLGNLEYQRRGYDAARSAFAEASRRDGATIGALSRLGLGYAWEAKGEPARALEAYRDALASRAPKDFLYGELLLATGRVQEQLNQPAAAIETYKRFLRDLPAAAQADEVRMRLAILGASA